MWQIFSTVHEEIIHYDAQSLSVMINNTDKLPSASKSLIFADNLKFLTESRIFITGLHILDYILYCLK